MIALNVVQILCVQEKKHLPSCYRAAVGAGCKQMHHRGAMQGMKPPLSASLLPLFLQLSFVHQRWCARTRVQYRTNTQVRGDPSRHAGSKWSWTPQICSAMPNHACQEVIVPTLYNRLRGRTCHSVTPPVGWLSISHYPLLLHYGKS